MLVVSVRVQSSFRYRNFGAFRLLLAALVVLQHFCAKVAPEELTIALQPLQIGSVAVLVFFCLSGFVIFEAADQLYQNRPSAFFANRLFRIVPHFVLALMFAVFLYFVFDTMGTLRVGRSATFVADAAFAIKNIVANLLGFFPWTNRWMNYEFIEFAWAVRIEMLFYIVVAFGLLIIHCAKFIGIRHLDLLHVGFWIAICFLPLFLLAMAGEAPAMFELEPYFVFGCSLYAVVKRGSWVAYATAGISLVGIAWQFLALPPQDPTMRFERAVDVQIVMLFLLLAVMIGLTFANLDKFRRLDRLLGDLTYPLYMWHMDVRVVVLSVTAGFSYVVLFLGLGASLFVACIAHAIVDPAMTRFRDFVRGRSLDQLWQYSSPTTTSVQSGLARRGL
jgi:peptidoglycan/LPS O-acetylase OafA/YrhL